MSVLPLMPLLLGWCNEPVDADADVEAFATAALPLLCGPPDADADADDCTSGVWLRRVRRGDECGLGLSAARARIMLLLSACSDEVAMLKSSQPMSCSECRAMRLNPIGAVRTEKRQKETDIASAGQSTRTSKGVDCVDNRGGPGKVGGFGGRLCWWDHVCHHVGRWNRCTSASR